MPGRSRLRSNPFTVTSRKLHCNQSKFQFRVHKPNQRRWRRVQATVTERWRVWTCNQTKVNDRFVIFQFFLFKLIQLRSPTASRIPSSACDIPSISPHSDDSIVGRMGSFRQMECHRFPRQGNYEENPLTIKKWMYMRNFFAYVTARF